MNAIRNTFLSTLVLVSSVLMAQQTTVVTGENFNDYGLVYSLPTTALRIDVTARHTVEKAGPFYKYAKKYIGTDDVITRDSEKWELTEITVTPYGVVDAEAENYRIVLKPGNPTFITVDENGMLRSINTEAPSTEKVAAETTAMTGTLPPMRMDEYLSFVDDEFLAAQSSVKRAQMLSEALMDVRNAKIELTRGTAENLPTDGKQLELMLSSLEKQEKAMVKAFVGDTQTETLSRSYTYTPGEEGTFIVGRLSDFAGFVGADDLRGEPIYITVEKTREGKRPTDKNGEVKVMPKDAVVYRIPGAARISLSYNGLDQWSGEMEMAQYGVRYGLNPALFTNKKSPAYAIFSPVTGNVEELGTQEKDGK